MTLRSAKRLLLALCCMTNAVIAAPAATPVDKPMAALIYADWCYNCKRILPRLEPLELAYADRIQFIRLNVTDEAAKAHTREQAMDLGIGPLYFNNRGTGVVLLVNRQREKVGELRYTLSDEQMRAALDALAAGLPIPDVTPAPAASP